MSQCQQNEVTLMDVGKVNYKNNNKTQSVTVWVFVGKNCISTLIPDEAYQG